MFGKRLKELRHSNNMTQIDLAESLNLSPSTIGMYEQSRREPDMETLLHISQLFNVSVDYLTGRSNIMRPTEAMDILEEKDGLYFHFAQQAKQLELSEDDVNFILDIYKKYKK